MFSGIFTILDRPQALVKINRRGGENATWVFSAVDSDNNVVTFSSLVYPENIIAGRQAYIRFYIKQCWENKNFINFLSARPAYETTKDDWETIDEVDIRSELTIDEARLAKRYT